MRSQTNSTMLVLLLSALLCLTSTALYCRSSQPEKVRIEDIQIQKVDTNKFHISMKIVNNSTSSIYIEGSNFDAPVPFPLYLEQWRGKEGWRIVAPCIDTAPVDVFQLRADGSLRMEQRYENPLPSVCRVRDILFEGKFRFRFNYFTSEKAARRHEEHFFSSNQNPGYSVLSDPFEISVPKK